MEKQKDHKLFHITFYDEIPSKLFFLGGKCLI